MTRRPALLAALTLAPLLLVFPAQAQVAPDVGNRTTLGPTNADAQGRQSDFIDRDGALFPKRRGSGIGVSSQSFANSDGSSGTRAGLVGSMSVAPNVNFGVGLFKINRTNGRDRDLGRLQPMRDLNERRSTMAAVGLSMRFR